MKTGVDSDLRGIEVRNSKGKNMISAIVMLLLSIFLLWLYLSGRDTQMGALIFSILLFGGAFLFLYSYLDRKIQIYITEMSIIIHGKEYFWKDVKDVKLKVYSGGGTNVSSEYLVLVLVDKSTKNGYREIETQIIGYDRTYTEIITYAKTYKKIYDERVSGKTPSTPSFRSDRRDMDSRQLAI